VQDPPPMPCIFALDVLQSLLSHISFHPLQIAIISNCNGNIIGKHVLLFQLNSPLFIAVSEAMIIFNVLLVAVVAAPAATIPFSMHMFTDFRIRLLLSSTCLKLLVVKENSCSIQFVETELILI
jgi:hypothetical protein